MERFFRKERLIDREKEIEFLRGWFDKVPKEILWLYGPKSSGKTTLIEYVIENELFEDFWGLKYRGNFWVRYINLRGYLITSYKSFLEAFIKPEGEGSKRLREEERLDARMALGIFEIKASILNKVRERHRDLFNVLISEIQRIARDRRVILIIDELQTLEDIYINDKRELLKEFLNFCVRITKELHIAHCLIISSNTIFIKRIFNDARLKVTSEFYRVGHLSRGITMRWLDDEGIGVYERDLIWEYVGGCIPLIQRILSKMGEMKALGGIDEYLKQEAFRAYAQIVDALIRSKSKHIELVFKKISEKILKDGFYLCKSDDYDEMNVIERFAENEILFYDPLNLQVTGSNRLYERGMEILLRE